MNRNLSTAGRLLHLSRRWIAAFLVLTTVSALFLASAASAADAEQTSAPRVDGKAAILMDAATGQVLYEQNADEPLPPASMSKMMTEYLVMKAINEGKLSWDTVITVTENAASQIGSRIFLAQGDKHTVEELYIAMSVGSANDATVQLAEAVAGSEEAFVALMNETARQLGMTNSHFVNSTGLDRADMPEKFRPDESAGETLMSARDNAILAYHILMEEPDFLKYSSLQEYKFRPRDKSPMTNWNWMLEANKELPALRKFAYDGVDGLKTGHTSKAGNCFTGTALRNGTRLIAVVMGVGGTTNEGKRFLETAKLFDYGFNGFEKKTLVEAKASVPEHETFKVKKGKQTKVPVVTATDITLLVPKGSSTEVTVSGVAPLDPIIAPVKQGDVLGQVTYAYTDPATGQAKEAAIDLIAAEDVDKGSWWRLLLRAIRDFFVGLFQGIVDLF